MNKKLTTEEFIERAKKVHGDKYDYSKVDYNGRTSTVCIICPEHGEFWQAPHNHLHGKGCSKCAGKLVTDTESFIRRAKSIHGDKYDYSRVTYVNTSTPICIICPIHGEFWQTPANHLFGKECKKCANEKRNGLNRKSTEQFIEEAKKIHGDKYDYSKVKYIGYHSNVAIICPKHGVFLQEPANHLIGKGCKKCSRNSYNCTTEEWIEEAKEVHGNKYDYSKVKYDRSDKEVIIICPKHGEFEQIPRNHLQGQGCPKCKESKLEKYTRKKLEENKIEYEYQKKFEWLGRQSLDFYLPKYKIAIECQGEQHYRPVDFGGKGEEWAKKIFEKTKNFDNIKLNKVRKNNIRMLYINEDNKDNFLNEIL